MLRQFVFRSQFLLSLFLTDGVAGGGVLYFVLWAGKVPEEDITNILFTYKFLGGVVWSWLLYCVESKKDPRTYH